MKLTFIGLFTTFLISISYSQDADLEKMNKEAFQALENSDPSVSEKANKFLEASLKKPASWYTVNAYTLMGIINKDKGYYVTSLNHYLKALNTAEKIKDVGRVSASLNNIGTVYKLQENYVKAKEYFQRSLDLEEKLNNPAQKSIRLYNIGEVYNEMDSLDLALNFFTNSLLIEQKEKSKEGIIFAHLGIADVYLKLDKLTEAELSLDKVGKSLEIIHVEESILYHKLMGEYLAKSGDNDGALAEFNIAIKMSQENDFRVHLIDIYENQVQIYRKKSDWREATATYDRLVSLMSEMNSIRVTNQLADLTFQNELNKKELEIKLIQEERDLAKKNELDLQKVEAFQTKVLWILVVTVLIIITMVIFGIRKMMKE